MSSITLFYPHIIITEIFIRLSEEGCSVSFCPPAQDWHKTDTSKSNSQAVSFHIYGEGWDMEKGIYVDKGFEKRISERGVIKDNSLLLPYIICS